MHCQTSTTFRSAPLQYLIALVLSLTCFSVSANTAFDTNNKFGTNLLSSSSENEPVSDPEFLKVDEAFVFNSEIAEGGLKLTWKIADAYYLYLERFKFRTKQNGVTIGEPQYSTKGQAKQDDYFGEVHVIHHQLEIFLPITLAQGTADADIKVTYQGCAEAGLCYPPRHQNTLYIPNTAQATSSTPPPNLNSVSAEAKTKDLTQQTKDQENQEDLESASGVFSFLESSSLTLIVGIFFLLGLGLTFTPCVFPMIPIITSIVAGQENPSPARSLLLSVAYVLGMAITYASAGVITGLLGASANIQAALQDPFLLTLFASVFFLLALAMFGVYELQLPAFIRDRLNTKSQNISGGQLTSVFFIGALSALVVSPCVSAPLAGALLYISTTQDALIGGLSLFSLGLGMGVPLILISVGGGAFLPKAGMWMNTVKSVFGVMLVAVSIWL